jgi:hypothetical protein
VDAPAERVGSGDEAMNSTSSGYLQGFIIGKERRSDDKPYELARMQSEYLMESSRREFEIDFLAGWFDSSALPERKR